MTSDREMVDAIEKSMTPTPTQALVARVRALEPFRLTQHNGPGIIAMGEEDRDSLLALVDAREGDAARIDWCEASPNRVYRAISSWAVYAVDSPGDAYKATAGYPTFRAAIDAARGGSDVR